MRSMGVSKFLVLLFLSVSATASFAQSTDLWLDDLTIQTYSEGIRPVAVKANYAGNPMQINGIAYQRGLGVQSVCVLSFYLQGNARQFTAEIGRDDEGNGDVPVKFYVIGDKKILYESGEMKGGDAPRKIAVDL